MVHLLDDPIVDRRLTLPRLAVGELEILRSHYWVLRRWNNTNLSAPYWRLYWNHEAGAEVRLGTARFPLLPDQLMLIAPSTAFTSHFDGMPQGLERSESTIYSPATDWHGPLPPGERLVHHLFIHFLVGIPYGNLGAGLFIFPLTAEMRALIDRLLPDLSAVDHTLSLQQSLRMHALLYQALAQIPQQVWPTAPADERIVTVMRYIDAHFAQPLNNADFAAFTAMAPKAFVRLFKQYTGQTPLGYQTRKRLEQASILLHQTTQSIEQIAESCGFTDRYYFTRLFKRAFDVGPATYRKTKPV